MVILIYTEEIWRDLNVPGVKPHLYEISNYGNIRNKKRGKGKILKTQVSNAGYKRLILQTGDPKLPERQFSIHRLVALTFIDNPDPLTKPFVNHKNGDKLNNFCDNLEWVTPQENLRHAVENNLHWQYVGEAHPNSIFTNELIMFIHNLSNDEGLKGREVCNIIREKYPELNHITDENMIRYIGRIRREERFIKVIENKGSTTIKRNID